MSSSRKNKLSCVENFTGFYDGLVICNETGVLTRLNQSYCQITGVTSNDVKSAMGRSMEDLVQEGFVDTSVTVEVLKKKKTVTLWQRIKTGRKVLATGNPVFDETGRIKSVVTIIRDSQLISSCVNNKQYADFWRKQESGKPEILTKNQEMKDVLKYAYRVAPSMLPVLLTGESGTGKDLVARAVHEHSDRDEGPFVPVNCAAINENLFEAELFGYEEGAFTGAVKKGKKGLLEMAHGGTLFLDEITEIPLSVQAKLLRFIQNNEYYRVGGTQLKHLDIRLVCATNRAPATAVQEGLLREDLYYRIAGLVLYIPPLRQRKEDINYLAEHFLESFSMNTKSPKVLDTQAEKLLEVQPWPGNVRELQNTIQRLSVMVENSVINEDDVLAWLGRGSLSSDVDWRGNNNYWDLRHNLDREILKDTLERCGGIRETARQLGISPSTVLRKKRKYGLS